MTPTAIAKAHRLLRRILNVAVEAGYLPRSPAAIKGAGIERAAEMRHMASPRSPPWPKQSCRAIGR